MEMVNAGLALPFEVTFDSAVLNVGMTVWDVTGVPAIVSGPLAMALLHGFTYYGKFTPTAGRAYVVEKAVYTDNALSTLDSNYRAGTEAFYAVDPSGGSGGSTSITERVIGEIMPNDPVTGTVRET